MASSFATWMNALGADPGKAPEAMNWTKSSNDPHRGQLDTIVRRMEAAAITPSGGKDWGTVFQRSDKDHSGQISWEEFYSMCRRVFHLKDSEKDLRAIFKSMDVDDSGEVSLDELVAFVNSHGKAMIPLRVTIVSAKGLQATRAKPKSSRFVDATGRYGQGFPDPYCICEVCGKRETTQFQTDAARNTIDPLWEHGSEVADFQLGDVLSFAIYDMEGAGMLLGRSTLKVKPAELASGGFQGDLLLTDTGLGLDQQSFIQVRIETVTPMKVERIDEPTHAPGPRKPQKTEVCVSARVHELHELHSKRQDKRNRLLEKQAEDLQRRLEEEALEMRRSKRVVLSKSDGIALSDRLFEEHSRQQYRRAQEKQRWEEHHERMLVRPSSGSSASNKPCCDRLYDDAKRRDEKRRIQTQEEELPVPQAKGNLDRCHQLYEDAAERERWAKMQADKQREADREDGGRLVSQKRDRSCDIQRVRALYEDHAYRLQEKEQRLRKRQEELKEQESLEAKPQRFTPKIRQQNSALSLAMQVESLDGELLLGPQSSRLLQLVKSAVTDAIVSSTEGAMLRPSHLCIRILKASPDLAMRSSCTIKARIRLPFGETPESLQARFPDELPKSVSKALQSLDGISAVAEAGVPSAIRVISARITLDVPSDGLQEEDAPHEKTQEVPCGDPSERADPRTDGALSSTAMPDGTSGSAVSAPRRSVAPPAMATNGNLAAAAVLATIHMRSHLLRAFDAEELRELASSLNSAIAIYHSAVADCERRDGYATLCHMPSQRICKTHLCPDTYFLRDRGQGPDPIMQLAGSLEDLLQAGCAAQAALKQLLFPKDPPDRWHVGEVRRKPPLLPMATFAYDPGVKSRDAAAAKTSARYAHWAGNAQAHRHVLDFARLAVVFPSCDALLSGLGRLGEKCEILAIRNYFASPTRLGARYVEVLLVVDTPEPHVCELRLEEASFFRAGDLSRPHLQSFQSRLRSLLEQTHGHDLDAMAYLASAALASAPESADLRHFRHSVARTFGSAVGCWRRCLDNDSQLSFARFRELCRTHLEDYQDMTLHLWFGLDTSLSGRVSLLELDPEAVVLLARLRAAIWSLVPEEAPIAVVFGRLAKLAGICGPTPTSFDLFEFRAIAKGLGFEAKEGDRLCRHLDANFSGNASEACVTMADIAWLRRLPGLLDIRAAMLCSQDLPDKWWRWHSSSSTPSSHSAEKVSAPGDATLSPAKAAGFYVIWQFGRDRVEGELFSNLEDAQGKYAKKCRKPYSVMLADAKFNELDFFGQDDKDRIAEFKTWWHLQKGQLPKAARGKEPRAVSLEAIRDSQKRCMQRAAAGKSNHGTGGHSHRGAAPGAGHLPEADPVDAEPVADTEPAATATKESLPPKGKSSSGQRERSQSPGKKTPKAASATFATATAAAASARTDGCPRKVPRAASTPCHLAHGESQVFISQLHNLPQTFSPRDRSARSQGSNESQVYLQGIAKSKSPREGDRTPRTPRADSWPLGNGTARRSPVSSPQALPAEDELQYKEDEDHSAHVAVDEVDIVRAEDCLDPTVKEEHERSFSRRLEEMQKEHGEIHLRREAELELKREADLDSEMDLASTKASLARSRSPSEPPDGSRTGDGDVAGASEAGASDAGGGDVAEHGVDKALGARLRGSRTSIGSNGSRTSIGGSQRWRP